MFTLQKVAELFHGVMYSNSNVLKKKEGGGV